MQRRSGIEQRLAVLSVCSDVDIDQQLSPQSGHSDRRHQMIDRRGGKNREPYREEPGNLLGGKSAKRAIDLKGFHETQSVLCKRGKSIQAIRWVRRLLCFAKVAAKVRRGWQPVHHYCMDRTRVSGWLFMQFRMCGPAASMKRSEEHTSELQ